VDTLDPHALAIEHILFTNSCEILLSDFKAYLWNVGMFILFVKFKFIHFSNSNCKYILLKSWHED
jgi:hypothetical protein